MKLHWSHFLPVVAVIALVAAGWAAINYQNTYVPPADTNQLVNPDKLAAQSVLPDEISIPALMQRSYTGRDLVLGPVLDTGEGHVRYFITYQSDDLTITGTLVAPTGEGPFPVVVINHGLVDSSSYQTGSLFKKEQVYLAKRGYVSLVPDYRNLGGSDTDTDVDLNLRYGYVIDVINAIQAVRQANLAFIDTDRVGMIGYAMGGGIALAVAVSQPTLVDAFVLYAPISPDLWVDYQRWMSDIPAAEAIIARYGTKDSNPIFWENASPLHFLSQMRAPVLIHHGTADDYVPIEFSEQLVTELEAANNVKVIFDKYLDQGHDFAAAADLALERTGDFFDQYIQSSS